VSPRTAVCSSETLVTAVATGSTALVASYSPPSPTSKTATSTTSRRAKSWIAIAVTTSKKVRGSPLAARSTSHGFTSSTKSAIAASVIASPSTRTRSASAERCGEVEADGEPGLTQDRLGHARGASLPVRARDLHERHVFFRVPDLIEEGRHALGPRLHRETAEVEEERRRLVVVHTPWVGSPSLRRKRTGTIADSTLSSRRVRAFPRLEEQPLRARHPDPFA